MGGRRFAMMMSAFMLAVTLALPVFASPPTNITVAYDRDRGILHVTAQHPSDRLERYYLRRLEIYKNDVLDKTVTYPRQTAAWGMDEEIEYTAAPGDRLKVSLYSSDGGSGDAEMIVPEVPAETAAPVETAVPADTAIPAVPR